MLVELHEEAPPLLPTFQKLRRLCIIFFSSATFFVLRLTWKFVCSSIVHLIEVWKMNQVLNLCERRIVIILRWKLVITWPWRNVYRIKHGLLACKLLPEYNQKDPPRPSKECKGNAAHQFKNCYDFTLNGTIGLWRDFSISEHGFLECLFHSPNVRFPALDGWVALNQVFWIVNFVELWTLCPTA